MKDSSEQLNFLYTAIADTQQIIRAIDIKIGFIFLVQFIPLAFMDTLWEFYKQIPIHNGVSVLLYTTFTIWMLACIVLGICVLSIKFKFKDIDNSNSFFFMNTNVNLCNALFFKKISNSVNIEKGIKELPENQEAIKKTLLEELIKVSHVRDIKIVRVNICVYLTFFWVISSVFIYIFISLNGN